MSAHFLQYSFGLLVYPVAISLYLGNALLCIGSSLCGKVFDLLCFLGGFIGGGQGQLLEFDRAFEPTRHGRGRFLRVGASLFGGGDADSRVASNLGDLAVDDRGVGDLGDQFTGVDQHGYQFRARSLDAVDQIGEGIHAVGDRTRRALHHARVAGVV
ncbi:hypothetical protein ACQP0C_00895 [Nocardia sp. CA-129566]|uniref:hypothetical protein n=1 Tax=Nocardia sp. CA-129566 TaxID=3239976 RepID=UPI003D981A85